MTMRIFSTISERLKLKGETENVGVCTKERKSIIAEVLMATHARTEMRPRLRGIHPVRDCRNHISVRAWTGTSNEDS